ncbi:MAG: hypothetical protein QOD00_1185 [Blastocatellia bacterium]|jgi:hypothetical protein|nr:hypothetical protein [Blastocatellia bacterium]
MLAAGALDCVAAAKGTEDEGAADDGAADDGEDEGVEVVVGVEEGDGAGDVVD